MVDNSEWQALLNQTESLVKQDFHSFPRVDRNLSQLQQLAESVKARTANKQRSLNEQLAATRLLARQGFDAGRLTQETATLELQATFEDISPDAASSVEEYLSHLQEMTILTAIQESQQDTTSAFERFMDECVLRDWASDRRRLFGVIAPQAVTQLLGRGHPGRSADGVTDTGQLVLGGGEAATGKAAAYAGVIRRMAAAGASGERFDAAAACREALSPPVGGAPVTGTAGAADAAMAAAWRLLSDILQEAEVAGVSVSSPARYVDALARGARRHLEAGHARHVHSWVSRHRVTAQRGADPDMLRDIQAYLAVKMRGRGDLDFQQPGGHDTSWIQVYYALRSGWADAALRAAARASDAAAARVGNASLEASLRAWLSDRDAFRAQHGAQIRRECDHLLTQHRQRGAASPPQAEYVIALLALMGGDAAALDALLAVAPGLASTIEDFMWARLTLLAGPGQGHHDPPGLAGGGPMPLAGPVPYTLRELQGEINRWPPQYYSKEGKEPLLYLTVLLLSLQFAAAVRFLCKDKETKAYRIDGVHLAAVLVGAGVQRLPGEEELRELAGRVLADFGAQLAPADSALALHYYMAAADARGGGLPARGAMLRELLSVSRDYGTLLGGGGAVGTGGALSTFVRDPEEKRRLLEAVAYDCQMDAQPQDAIELFMAAGKPGLALQIINRQLSGIMAQSIEEEARGVPPAPGTQSWGDLRARGRDAVGQLGRPLGGPGDAAARGEVDAFTQLQDMRAALLACRCRQYGQCVDLLRGITFLPLDTSRVEACCRQVALLHPAVLDRVPDLLAVAAEAFAAMLPAKPDQMRPQASSLAQYIADGRVAHLVPQGAYERLAQHVGPAA